MRSLWEECTADTGTPATPPDEGERNDVAELSGKDGCFMVYAIIINYINNSRYI